MIKMNYASESEGNELESFYCTDTGICASYYNGKLHRTSNLLKHNADIFESAIVQIEYAYRHNKQALVNGYFTEQKRISKEFEFLDVK